MIQLPSLIDPEDYNATLVSISLRSAYTVHENYYWNFLAWYYIEPFPPHLSYVTFHNVMDFLVLPPHPHRRLQPLLQLLPGKGI